jgi:hypothetical protein
MRKLVLNYAMSSGKHVSHKMRTHFTSDAVSGVLFAPTAHNKLQIGWFLARTEEEVTAKDFKLLLRT